MRWIIACVFLVACSSSPSSTPPADAPIDAEIDVCLTCAAGQICVALYDGVCTGLSRCVAKTVDCPLNACTVECQDAYCPSPYQCMTRTPCEGASPHAFFCRGP
ncbi:MAG: hypothetical protein ABIY55_30030 [Kofleriaceae bacterium]